MTIITNRHWCESLQRLVVVQPIGQLQLQSALVNAVGLTKSRYKEIVVETAIEISNRPWREESSQLGEIILQELYNIACKARPELNIKFSGWSDPSTGNHVRFAESLDRFVALRKLKSAEDFARLQQLDASVREDNEALLEMIAAPGLLEIVKPIILNPQGNLVGKLVCDELKMLAVAINREFQQDRSRQ